MTLHNETITHAAAGHPAAAHILGIFQPNDRICIMLLRKGDPVVHWFQTAEVVAGEAYLRKLKAKNDQGYSVYICMSPLDADRRIKENVSTIRTVYLDADKGGEEIRQRVENSFSVPTPNAVLETSPGKFQFIWSVTNITPAEQESLLKAMVAEFNTDPADTDCTRVLRLPGFINHKYESKPVVQAIQTNYRPLIPYNRADFDVEVSTNGNGDGYKPPFRAPDAIHDGSRNDTLLSLAASLRSNKKQNLSDDAVRQAVHAENLAKCQPPLDSDEVDSIVESALRPEYKKKDAEWQKAKQQSPAKVSKEVFAKPALTFVAMDTIEAEIQEWLWLNRFPLNALSTLVGEPDKGKSNIGVDMLARLSTGREFPDGSPNPFGRPISVLLFNAEDPLKQAIKPRLMEAGADMKRVFVAKMENKQFSLDEDLPTLRAKLLENPEVKFIVIDPVMSYLGNEVDAHRDQAVRAVLTPLGDMAEELGITVLGVAHFNKNITANAINRVGGSIAITAVPRAVWCCVEDPENRAAYLMLPVKGNLGKKRKGLSYSITEDFVEIKGKQASVPKLNWGAETEQNANDLLNAANNPEMRGVGQAKKWLGEYLKDGLGHLSANIYDAATEAGITVDPTLKRAKKQLNIQPKQVNRRWFMRLPNDANLNGKAPWKFAVDEPVDEPDDESECQSDEMPSFEHFEDE